MNDPSNLGDDLFAFKVNYNDPTHGGTALYNGNIAETEWKTANDNQLRWYRYGHDAMDRIVSAIDNTTDQRYSLLDVQYDLGGNITKLKRNGHRDINVTSFGLMDDLTFQYNGNQLKSVDDAVAASAVTGFVEGAENATEYLFDGNGNMVRDDNKKITSVEYNHLNMPTKITVTGTGGGTLDYVYAADRTKLRKVNSNGTTTDYANGHIYENGNLVQFFHPEGYVEPDGSGGYTYVYQYRDQIENVRLSYADLDNNGSINASTEILHERNYFPFGVLHRGYNGNINGVVNNYKQYQGQEYTEDLSLGIHEWRFRFSDPTIGGRFWSIDPLAEQYSYQSPYNFSENRVIDAFELEGLEKVSIHNRAFAPFETFGRGFSGDGADRRFTTSSTVTSRVSQTVDIDFDQSTPTVSDGQQVSDLSHHPILGTDRAPVKEGLKNVQTGETSTGAKQVSFQTEIEGANPLTGFAGPLNPNIDLDGAFSISSNQETGVLSISANITGDNFPAAESFISDSAGNSIFIGVSALQGSPASGLPGEGGNERINNDLRVNFNSEGVFQNVIYQGQQYSIQDYNKLFETQNPNGN